MILPIYLTLLVSAIVATAFTIYVGASGGVGSMQLGPRMGIVISAVTILLWGMVAINSFEIVHVSGGQEFTRSYESVAWIAAGGGVLAVVSLFKASVDEIRRTGGIQ